MGEEEEKDGCFVFCGRFFGWGGNKGKNYFSFFVVLLFVPWKS